MSRSTPPRRRGTRRSRPSRARTSARRKRDAAGVLLIALGSFLAVSFVPDPAGRENLVGPLGAASYELLAGAFSWGGLLAPILAVLWGIVLVRGRGSAAARRFSAVAGLGTLASLTLVSLLSGSGAAGSAEPGGSLSAWAAENLTRLFGLAGACIALALVLLLALALAGGSRPGLDRTRLSAAAAGGARVGRALLWTLGVLLSAAVWLFSWVGGLLGVLGVALAAARARLGGSRPVTSRDGLESGIGERVSGATAPPDALAGAEEPRSRLAPAPGGRRREGLLPHDEEDELGVAAGSPPRGSSSASRQAPSRGPEPPWEVPLEIFDPPAVRDAAASERELQDQAAVLIRKLADFNVHGEVVRISAGPVITQFEVEPAPGVKVNQIANLADDLALAMRAQRIRIVAPIPGKGAVGIEIPNRQPELVTIREILASPAFTTSRATLPLALGKEISGVPVVTDLTRMPHLLIAGSTGSGKSVCINAVLTSLLYRFSPADLRLVLIDPKMLELSVYNEVPHLLHPVVTRAKDAATALKWAVYEMDRRFELLARNAVRNVTDFNARLRSGSAMQGVESKLGTADEPPRPLPHVVVVVDELADLMLTVQAEIEEPLARLAQKARAVGLHVVLATQRPSVNVLTGFIKANFPSRISFQVASKTDSRTILDQNGAEALLGQGDMLFLPADRAAPIRIQGAFVSGRETEALVSHVRELGKAREYRERETIDLHKVESVEDGQGPEDRDELFFEAARIVIEHDQGSTSLLQRRLKVGYSRAARIVDQLERGGIVGPPEGSKPREVRIGLEELAEMQAAGRGTTPASRSSIAP